MAESLRHKSMRGLGWAFGQQAGSQLSRILFSILLARVLSPGDYGLLGLGLLCVNFLQIVSTFGLGDGLIQAGRRVDPGEVAALFRMHILIATATGLALFLVAPFVAAWYQQETLTPILRLLSLTFLLSIGVVIPRAILERSLQFEKVARRAVPSTVVSGVSALLAAHAGWGVYSLVVLALVEPIILSISLLPWIPRGKPSSFRSLRPVIRYSWKLSLAGALGFIGKNIDAVVIGRWISPAQLGLYQMGFRLTRLPIQNFAAVIDRVLFPSFSSIQHDRIRVSRAYVKVIRATSILVMPLMTLIAVSLETAIPWILSGTWLDAIPVMKVFCLMAFIQTIGRSKNAIVQAMGRSDLVLAWVFLAAPVDILTVALSAKHGILAVATSLVAARACVEGIQLVVIARLLGSPVSRLLRAAASGIPLSLALAGESLLLFRTDLPRPAALAMLALSVLVPLVIAWRRLGRNRLVSWLAGDPGS